MENQQTSLLNKIIKIVISIILVSILVLAIIHISKGATSVGDGNVTVIVNNINNEIVSTKRIKYEEGDTLFDVINKEYIITCDDAMYGHYITGIEGEDFKIETSGDTTGWIWLEVAYLKEDKTYNEVLNFDDYQIIDVNKGIDSIEIKDNMILALNQRDNSHETSVLNQNIVIENIVNDILKIIGIIIFIFLVISLIGYVIYSFIRKKEDNITVKQMCVLAFMAVILFVQEELLSFIPNVQFTFLLISLYAAIFGFKKTSIIIFIHVLLDNLVMGSLNAMVMIPMFIGYELTALLVGLVKNRVLGIKILMAVIGSVVYSLCFIAINSLVYDIDIVFYIIADIPFEIILVISTIVSMMYLYTPLEKLIKKNWEAI